MTFDLNRVQRAFASIAGALFFATIFVTAAVGPVEAAVLVAPVL